MFISEILEEGLQDRLKPYAQLKDKERIISDLTEEILKDFKIGLIFNTSIIASNLPLTLSGKVEPRNVFKYLRKVPIEDSERDLIELEIVKTCLNKNDVTDITKEEVKRLASNYVNEAHISSMNIVYTMYDNVLNSKDEFFRLKENLPKEEDLFKNLEYNKEFGAEISYENACEQLIENYYCIEDEIADLKSYIKTLDTKLVYSTDSYFWKFIFSISDVSLKEIYSVTNISIRDLITLFFNLNRDFEENLTEIQYDNLIQLLVKNSSFDLNYKIQNGSLFIKNLKLRTSKEYFKTFSKELLMEIESFQLNSLEEFKESIELNVSLSLKLNQKTHLEKHLKENAFSNLQ